MRNENMSFVFKPNQDNWVNINTTLVENFSPEICDIWVEKS